MSFTLYATARPCVTVFVGAGQTSAIAEGVSYMQILSFFYVLSYIGSSFVGFFRGSGRINIPLIGTTLHISLRVILSYWLAPKMGLKAVGLATGIGWIAIVIFQLTVFFLGRRREEKGDPFTPQGQPEISSEAV